MKACPLCGSARVRHERILNGISLLQCEPCAFCYADLDDRVIEAENRTVFDVDAARVYEARQTALDEVWFDSVAARLTRDLDPGRVLDVGCGNGRLLASFRARGWEAHGVDFSSWAEPYARRLGFTLHRAKLEEAGLPDGAFDVVTSTSTLEHIARPYEHVREIVRVLKPGGRAYFAGMPNYGSLSIRLGLSAFAHNLPPPHVNFFTTASFRRLFARPELALQLSGVRVTTYGVPEVQGVVEKMTERWRARRRAVLGPAGDGLRRSSGAETSASEGAAPRSSAVAASVPKVFRKAAITLYYRAGRLFDMGDKLEALIGKRG
jgi:ubiquinone/menaquinone biosynthesis C-methylase UbiE